LGASMTYLFWGESILGACQLLGAALLVFSPFILNTAGLISSDKSSGPVSAALNSLVQGGMIMGAIGLVVLATDLTILARTRVQQGSRADQLRYGKGVREE